MVHKTSALTRAVIALTVMGAAWGTCRNTCLRRGAASIHATGDLSERRLIHPDPHEPRADGGLRLPAGQSVRHRHRACPQWEPLRGWARPCM